MACENEQQYNTLIQSLSSPKTQGMIIAKNESENNVTVIFPSFNNFLNVRYDENTGEYTVVFLDDYQNPATETKHWPSGSIKTRSIKFVINIIANTYSR